MVNKDKSLKLAAATVTLTVIIGCVGALFIRTAALLVVLVGSEALILIGTGIALNKMAKEDDKNKGH
jgi:hypothetical protein